MAKTCYCLEAKNNFTIPICDSHQRNNNSSKIRIREGWKLQWTPVHNNDNGIQAVVPGIFIEPRLLKAIPYVVLSSCRHCSRKNHPLARLRSGIPDPWLEYLAWKESKSAANEGMAQRDVRLHSEYVRLTDFIWNEKGVPMLQGIPDPWKSDVQLVCDADYERKKKNIKLRNKGINRNVCDDYPKSVSRTRRNEKVNFAEPAKVLDERFEKSQSNGFDKIKNKLSKLDEELTMKYIKKEAESGGMEKLADAKLKEKKRRIGRKKEIYADNSYKPVGLIETRERKNRRKCKNKSEVKFHEDKDDITEARQSKMNKRKSKSQPYDRSEERTRETYSLYGGNCGRFCRNSSAKDGLNNESKELCARKDTEDVKEILEQINGRIKITTDVLNSPDLSDERIGDFENRRIITARNVETGRVRGGGDKVENKQEGQLLFQRRFEVERGKGIRKLPPTRNFECLQKNKVEESDLILSDCEDDKFVYPEQRYRKNSLNTGNDGNGKESSIIIESLTD